MEVLIKYANNVLLIVNNALVLLLMNVQFVVQDSIIWKINAM
jgi:hypothetical protein